MQRKASEYVTRVRIEAVKGGKASEMPLTRKCFIQSNALIAEDYLLALIHC